MFEFYFITKKFFVWYDFFSVFWGGAQTGIVVPHMTVTPGDSYHM